MPKDFLESISKAVFDKAEGFGIFATPYAPIILLALVFVIIICIFAALKSRGKRDLVRVLEEAKDREVDCRYDEAWELFLKYEKKAKPGADIYFHMGMFCLSAKEDGWNGSKGNCDPAFWLEKAASMGHTRANFNLLKVKFSENLPENLLECAEIIREIRKIAEKDLFEAEKFLEKTKEELDKKAEDEILGENEAKAVMGDEKAQLLVGKSLCAKNEKENGFKWVLMAAENGDVTAQSFCGEIYREGGETVPKDLEKAFFWHEKAALAGNLDSAFVLGGLYYYGKGCEKNLSEAAKWFAKAADSGNARAAYNASICYYNCGNECAERKGLTDVAEKKLDEEVMEKYLLAEDYRKLAKKLGYKEK